MVSPSYKNGVAKKLLELSLTRTKRTGPLSVMLLYYFSPSLKMLCVCVLHIGFKVDK